MKITSIKINNYLGLRELTVQDPAKVLLLAGFNGAGKSSTAEAIRHALENKFERVQYKKDLMAIMNDGATSGHVIIGTDLGEYGVTLPSGDVAGDYSALNPFLSYCLRPALFSSLAPEDRRGMLFKLMGVKINGESIGKRLIEKGADEERAALIRPYLSGGFDAGNKQALEFARDAKAQWRAVTGETYGDKKAETWKMSPPDGEVEKVEKVDKAQLAAADVAVTRLAGEQGVLRARKAQADKLASEASGREQKLADLRAQAAKYAEIQDAINQVEQVKALALSMIEGIKASIATAEQKPIACPHCAGLVEYSVANNVPRLTRYEGETIDPAELAEAQASLDLHQKAIADADANIKKFTLELNEADRAAVELNVLESTDPQIFDTVAMIAEFERVNSAILAAEEKRNKLRQDAQTYENQARIQKTIDETNANALRWHCDVKAWDLIADALSPSGIQAELLAEAIEPFNLSLQSLCTGAGWMAVEVDGDMNILVDGMPYTLRSEGEQWRADAILATAIAQNSGVNMIMLDRFDVLDAGGRNQLIKWLGSVALDAAVVMGTMKQAPAGLPSFITPIWLSGE